jgi:hypothetical protein
MLYPKREQELGPEEFRNPTSEYRATPFWAWNSKLDRDDLVWQIGELRKLGFGGFHMHVRSGMATGYLSDEYMALVRACVEKARQERMIPWLYDEDRWPSGAAGGLVTRNPEYRIRHLLLTRHPYGTPGEVVAEKKSRASSGRTENGTLLACFTVELDGRGNLAAYRRISAEEAARNAPLPAGAFRLWAYLETALPNPWFNNQTYVDTLKPQAIREFIRVTYERYHREFGGDFGGLIPAIFTDEPQFSRKGTLHFAQEDRDVTLPWTGDLAETYRAAYGGEELLEAIPELLWDLPGGKTSRIRYHYHDHIAERFAAAFADQCGAWCGAHGIMLTGHMMEEPTLESQTHALGEAMRSYRSFQLPGIDMLCDLREFTTAKQAQSAARQYGCPGVLSELYGVTNWDFDFRGHKLQGDWQACLGITVRVPHLSWVSMNGEAKRDYPGTFNYQAPWYREYPYVEDHFARLNTALTRGRALVRVGVIHPIESYWLHWGPRENTQAVRGEMDRRFQDLCGWLLRGTVDFDYICESTLPGLCEGAEIRSSSAGTVFPVGKMAYQAVLVPPMETIRSSTLERLEAFRKAGGRIIFLGEIPSLVDALPNDSAGRLAERSERIGFDRISLLGALEDLRDLQIRDSSGAESSGLIYQMREESGGRWLFIAQADKARHEDIPRGDLYRLRIRGEWQPVKYDTLSGESYSLKAEASGGWTVLAVELWDHDSLLLKLVKPGTALPPPKAGEEAGKGNVLAPGIDGPTPVVPPCTRFTGPVPVTLHEPNVLILDMAEYALDKGEWREREEILRLDNLLRDELGWPSRGEAFAQPWVENDESTPHTLRLRYTFESELDIPETELALENAGRSTVSLNGQAAGPVQGWFTDKSIGKVKLPALKKGSNVLEISLPYGRKVDVEACFLLGDFGVKVAGSYAGLVAPVRRLAFGDITRQGLPFYGGSLTYHLEGETKAGEDLVIEAASYRFMALKVKVDGIDRGFIAYAPYRLRVEGLSPGKHAVDITGLGCRINTFGQLHNNMDHAGYWWGPNSWRTLGPAWTYEYKFWPQGVLKSPEIFACP